MLERVAYPLWSEAASELRPSKATQLELEVCTVAHARMLISLWHSRLPRTQRGPWKLAMHAFYGSTTYAVALWHNPSARMLPQNWLELRRMAVASDAPHCTASWFLRAMEKWIRRHYPECERLISYQDTEVHRGTIYRAAGWQSGAIQKPRVRDRSKPRPSGRMYRWNLNGVSADGAGKVRWECSLLPNT